jgi:two-component system, sensor histidine kinase and response regulator
MGSIGQKQFKILVVDDNAKNIQVIGQILKETEYLIGYALGGQQALDILEKDNSFDLILLDVSMPIMNGFETCLKIRENPSTSDIPIIFVTALTNSESIVEGFDAGAQDYVTKPFNSKELLSRVRTQLELKHGKDQLEKINEWLQQKVDEKTKELQHAYYELNKLDKLKNNYLIMISHEIQSPVSSLVGTINLIKSQEQSFGIKSLIDTLNNTISKLDSFAEKAVLSTNLSSSSFKPLEQDVRLNELVQFVLMDFVDKIQSKEIEILNEIPDKEVLVKADRDLIFKALTYILDNAVKYSPFKGKITLSLQIFEEELILSITDNGDGISTDTIKSIIDPYGSGDSADSTERIGLSLTIVKQIMGLSNGSINIFNKVDSGACVELIFNR